MTRNSTDATVVAFLLANEALTATCEQRIWGGCSVPPPGADYKPSDGGAICLQTVTGRDEETDLLRHEQVQFKCYSDTPANADILAGVLHGALQNQRSTRMKWARRSTTPRVLLEPETEWPYAFTQYAIMVHQEV
jgi:hypothetical protein